jgi:hypothetical protein
MATQKKSLTKSQIVAHFAEKFDFSKKTAAMILDEVAAFLTARHAWALTRLQVNRSKSLPSEW